MLASYVSFTCLAIFLEYASAVSYATLQDPVPKMAKFWFLYARPGQRVLLYKNGDIVISPTPLDIRLQDYRRSEASHTHVCT